MKQEGGNQQDFEQWRQKYYDSLEKLEQKQEQWEGLEKTLRRCISRLALAADGIHPEIDVQLESLRKAIRDGVGAVGLQDRIEGISQALLKLDQRPAPKPAPTETAAVENRAETAPGFLGKLLGGLSSKGARETPVVAEVAQPRGIPSDVHEALAQLLERLALQPEMTEQVEVLKQQLGEDTDPSALSSSLQSIAVLVADALDKIRSEKSDLEAFLLQLTERLQEIDQRLSDNAITQQASQQNQHQLDIAVHAQVEGIETTMKEVSDIGQLKQVIQRRLDGIREHMDTFRQDETQRQVDSKHQVDVLTSRLRDMEKEISRLHSRVRKEQENALQDALTGIPNRMAYEKRVADEYARWRRYHAPLSMIVIDIDHFKRVNDLYGHQAGDKVIRVIAQELCKHLRDVDFMARYGGEEFVILLPETNIQSAGIVADKLCAGVRGCEFQHSGSRVPITVSGGVAQFGGVDTVAQVFERADAALYRSKHKGRDQWSVEE
ncbi:MAG: diguanylate cyclase [Gammaproteobacteria bacterium]